MACTRRPLLTIGLSVHNAAAYLPLALGSIVAQTFTDWELLAVDDGSRDDSAAVLASLHDPRVRVLDGGRNLGLAARLNQIAREARGRYVARMDADDLMHPTRLAAQLQFLRDHPEVDGVGCSLLVLDHDLQPAGVRIFPESHAGICADPLHGVHLAHATFVARTDWLRAHSYNEANRTCEDWELWFATYRHSRFANLAAPLYFYREFASYSLLQYLRAKRQLAMLRWTRRADFGHLPVLLTGVTEALRCLYHLGACALDARDHLVRRRSRALTAAAATLFAEAWPSIFEQTSALFPAERRPLHAPVAPQPGLKLSTVPR